MFAGELGYFNRPIVGAGVLAYTRCNVQSNFPENSVTPTERSVRDKDLPDCVRVTTKGKIVSAHCTLCGAFIAAGQKLDRLKAAIDLHPCVRRGCD